MVSSGLLRQIDVGSRINAQFEVLGILGAGGFATVYKARQISVDRLVAIKVLELYLDEEEEQERRDFETRFSREGQVMASLHHPGVVRVFDFGFTDNTKQPYLVMELLEGHSLAVELRERGRMAPARVLPLICESLEALAYVHRQGIIHRDIKPANFFLIHPGTADEAIRILDFGLAAIEEDEGGRLTKTGEMLGTYHYMAPEYIVSKTITPALDVYQVGLLLVELLVGRPAVQAESQFQCLNLHVEGRLDIPTTLRRSTLGPILDRALKREPGDRYADAGDFLAALRTIDPTAMLAQIRDQASPSKMAPQQHNPRKLGGTAMTSSSSGRAASTASTVRSSRGPRLKGSLVALGLIIVSIAVAAVAVVLARSATERAVAATAPEPLVKSVPQADTCEPAACATKGPTHLCIGTRCVAAASAQCSTVLRPKVPRSDDVVIAAIGSEGGAYDGMALAASELAGVASEGRQEVWVQCNSEGDPAKARAAAKHVAVTLGAPIVVSSETGAAFEATAKMVSEAGRAVIALRASDGDLDGKRWSIGGASRDEGPALAAWIKQRAPKRVVVIARDDAVTQAIVAPVRGVIDELRVKQVAVETVTEAKPTPETIDVLVAKVLSDVARPDLVLMLGHLDAVALLQGFKGKIPAKATFLVSGGRRDALLGFVAPVDQKSTWAPFRKKLLWTGSSATGEVARGFAKRFTDTYKVAPEDGAAAGYDAIYTAAYALKRAAGSEDLTGAIEALGKGPEVPVGPTAIEVISAKLANGGSVNLNGATGGLEFDAHRRTRRTVGLWRFGHDAAGELAARQVGTYEPAADGAAFGWTLDAR